LHSHILFRNTISVKGIFYRKDFGRAICGKFYKLVTGSGRWNELVVALAAALGSEEIIISAAQAFGVFAADSWPRIVDRASARLFIKKLADLLEYMIAFTAKHALAVGDLRVPLLGLLIVEAEMAGQPLDVDARNFDTVVAATVRGAFRAIKEHAQLSPVCFYPAVIDNSHSSLYLGLQTVIAPSSNTIA
jgi:hypothetical protein